MLCASVPTCDDPVQILGDDRIFRRFDNRRKPAFGLVYQFALADIADRTRNQNAFCGHDWTKADLDRELGSSFAHAQKFHLRSHSPETRLGKETHSMESMPLAEMLRE